MDRPADKVRAAIHSTIRSTNRAATARPFCGQGTAATLDRVWLFHQHRMRSALFVPAQCLLGAAVTTPRAAETGSATAAPDRSLAMVPADAGR